MLLSVVRCFSVFLRFSLLVLNLSLYLYLSPFLSLSVSLYLALYVSLYLSLSRFLSLSLPHSFFLTNTLSRTLSAPFTPYLLTMSPLAFCPFSTILNVLQVQTIFSQTRIKATNTKANYKINLKSRPIFTVACVFACNIGSYTYNTKRKNKIYAFDYLNEKKN